METSPPPHPKPQNIENLGENLSTISRSQQAYCGKVKTDMLMKILPLPAPVHQPDQVFWIKKETRTILRCRL
jgi:hypothetical protein